MEYKYGEIVAASDKSQEDADKDYLVELEAKIPRKFICNHPEGGYIISCGSDSANHFKYISNKKPIEAPKYKVGDYAMSESAREYIKVYSVKLEHGGYKYNTVYLGDGTSAYYSEESLREPTKEELKLYFR